MKKSIYEKMTHSEREVADYLKRVGLKWVFEFPVFVYDERDRQRLWTPDFYIPKLALYVEVCGSKEFDYEYRKEIYNKNGIPVAFLHYYKEPGQWKYFLAKRVEEIGQERQAEANKLKYSLEGKSQRAQVFRIRKLEIRRSARLRKRNQFQRA